MYWIDMEKFELINNYINGKLNLDEKESLEAALRQDENLRNLLEQERLVKEAVTQHRTLQLKARMDAVSVGSSVSNYVRIAASLLILGGISAGGYYYYNTLQNNKIEPTPNLGSLNKPTIKEAPEQIAKPQPVAKPMSKSSETKPKADAPKEAFKHSNSNDLNPSVHQEDIDIASPSDFNSHENKSSDNDNLATPIKTLKTDVAIELNDSEDLKYRNFNSKLYLIGKFDKKYEIIELKSNRLYLNYDGVFYYLRSNVQTSSDLERVKDPILLKTLKDKSVSHSK